MTTITMLPQHLQIQSVALSITPTYTSILTNAQYGQYTLSLVVGSTFSFLITIVLLPGNVARCTSIINCGMAVDQFYNNVAQCPLLDGINNNFTLQFQYLGGNLSVETIVGGTLTGCTFYLLYSGVGAPNSGTSMLSIDSIQSSTGSNVSFSSSLSTIGRFRNIKTITTNTTLNSTYDIVNCNATGPVTISLPQTITATGACYSFVNNTTNSVSISTFSGDTINNGSSTSVSLASQYATTTLTSLGNNIWYTGI